MGYSNKQGPPSTVAEEYWRNEHCSCPRCKDIGNYYAQRDNITQEYLKREHEGPGFTGTIDLEELVEEAGPHE